MTPRERILARLRAGEAEGLPLIVGGGINGIGVLRDLAHQGVPALLVEAGDFAGGASAAPSRLIHGGLRYLETGEFALVRESVEERNRMLINAPHQVAPLPVWVPALSHFGGAAAAGLRFLRLRRDPGPKGALVIRLGLAVFDRFGEYRRTMPRHRAAPLRDLRARLGLSPRVKAVLEYHDARLRSPERLALELIGDAEAETPGAMAANWLALEGIGDGAAILRDRIGGESFAVRPSMVFNCAGAWADRANAMLGMETRLIGGNRGSHLVMERPDLAGALGEAMLYFETHDHRACLVYALDGRMILLGTTDLRDADPDGARCSEEEIDYLFRVLAEILPDAAPARDQIRYVFSGVRPLPRADGGADGGAAGGSTGAVSRDHAFVQAPPGEGRPFPVLTLVGGKWTTYRACAAQMVDRAAPLLGLGPRASTGDLPIGGGAGFPRDAAGRAEMVARIAAAGAIPDDAAARLLRRHGAFALEIASELDAAGRIPFAPAPDYLVGELRRILRRERVARLEDFALRRVLMAFEGALTPACVAGLADLAAEELGWDPARRAEEVARLARILAERGRVPGFDGAAREEDREEGDGPPPARAGREGVAAGGGEGRLDGRIGVE